MHNDTRSPLIRRFLVEVCVQGEPDEFAQYFNEDAPREPITGCEAEKSEVDRCSKKPPSRILLKKRAPVGRLAGLRIRNKVSRTNDSDRQKNPLQRSA